MPDDNTPEPRETTGLPSVGAAALRILADLLIVGLLVLTLTLLFLTTNWPRWAFYALLFLSVGGYVLVTAPWGRSRRPAKG